MWDSMPLSLSLSRTNTSTHLRIHCDGKCATHAVEESGKLFHMLFISGKGEETPLCPKDECIIHSTPIQDVPSLAHEFSSFSSNESLILFILLFFFFTQSIYSNRRIYFCLNLLFIPLLHIGVCLFYFIFLLRCFQKWKRRIRGGANNMANGLVWLALILA